MTVVSYEFSCLGLIFTPLIHMCVSVPESCSLHDYTSVISSKIWNGDLSGIVLFTQDCFGSLGSLLLSCGFSEFFLYFCEGYYKDLDWDCTYSPKFLLVRWSFSQY